MVTEAGDTTALGSTAFPPAEGTRERAACLSGSPDGAERKMDRASPSEERSEIS